MRILYLPGPYSQQRQREKKANIYPVLLASEAEWYRRQGHEVQWGCGIVMPDDYYDKVIREPEGLPFLSLPPPDRIFTNAKSYTSGNYKYLPGTHMQVANGCWWGKCTFCVENVQMAEWSTHRSAKPIFVGSNPTLDSKYEVRPVEDCIEEIKEIKSLGFREVFDDSGTFPTGGWLDSFLNSISVFNSIRNNPNHIRFGCNMRLVENVDFARLHSVGFRMLLFGIESANQETLDKINKGVKVEDIIPTIKKASQAGLEPHISCMFGIPGESDEDAIRTLKLVHYLLRKGYAHTAQASFYTNGDDKGNESHRKYVHKIYNVAHYPEFWFRQITSIKNKDDIKYLWRKIKAGLGWK